MFNISMTLIRMLNISNIHESLTKMTSTLQWRFTEEISIIITYHYHQYLLWIVLKVNNK